MRKITINPEGHVEIQHFDAGGTVLPGPGSATTGSGPNTSPNLINNFSAGSANVQAGTNTGQLQNAYGQAQQGIGEQQGISGATSSGVQPAVTSQQALLTALQNQANGQGPNPAQAELNQNTAANVSNQAALMAGQRGASGNVGLAATQNAQQGALTQQNAVGQAATLQAQQQLAAQQQLEAQQAQMVNQGVAATGATNTATQNEQSILQGANTNYNNSAVS